VSAAPWSKPPSGVASVTQRWLGAGKVRPCLALDRLLPAQTAHYATELPELHEAVQRALATRGIGQLYTHQAEAIGAALAGRHVVVATPTSSGKSLCFHLPVLDALARDPTATALYLYPTKALSRDQEHSLKELVHASGLSLGAMVYDGDTRGDARRAVRERARIVLSNPDMLHAGILPNHGKWAALFESLRYVILDELHTYRGVFGSHMAHVIARLKRVAAFHGSHPTFLSATATIGNPREHAARLLGVSPEEVTLVDRSGAPSASRQVLLYNPPIVDETLMIRGSALKHAVSLAAELVEARVPTLVFGESRNSVEIMLKYLRERCSHVAGPDAIMAYRGGYLPEKRRAIERGLREGEILCAVATNALELGIDIGDLDAVICTGYPGSIASTWQRFGRAGRRGAESIALLVCSSRAVDQYLAREPDTLLARGAEEARIDPTNAEILIQHLKCAAFEGPFALNDPGVKATSAEPARGETYASLDAESTRDALEYLAKGGLVHHRPGVGGGRYYYAGEAYPASHVSLRSIGWDNFVIIDQESQRTLAELDFRATHTMLHEQAIYQHDAEQYQVEALDYENHKAYVRKVEPDYFTTALTYRDVEVIEELSRGNVGRGTTGFGEVKVVEKVTGYKKIKYGTHENAGYGDVNLPPLQMHTTSFWLSLPETLVASFDAPRSSVVEGLRAAGVALETVSTVALMCEPSDINRTLGDGYGAEPSDLPGRNADLGRTGKSEPTLFLFDAQPGGVGLAKRIFESAPEWIERAARLIESCTCRSGCPGCVGPLDSSHGGPKRMAISVLRALA
jgi:DEAD/DEAH box helicase domain-containing protein